jgi:F-type H+-transporting ATPase subunit delta
VPASRVSASAQRYARAAFQVASDAADLDGWLSMLRAAAELLEHPNARIALTSPAVPAHEKQAVIERVFPNLSTSQRNFLRILAQRGILRDLPAMTQAFGEFLNKHRGIITAEVTTAVPIDADLQRVLAERLGAYLKHDPQRVTVLSRVDPSIIGGVVARIGDTLIDDSVRGRLQRLRRALATF